MNPSEWLAANEHLLPRMSAGSRINGDPIIHTGKKPPEHIHREQLCVDYDDTEAKEERIQAIERVLVSRGFTARQLLVMRLRCECTQEQIARSLGVSRERVKAIQAQAKQRLTK